MLRIIKPSIGGAAVFAPRDTHRAKPPHIYMSKKLCSPRCVQNFFDYHAQRPVLSLEQLLIRAPRRFVGPALLWPWEKIAPLQRK